MKKEKGKRVQCISCGGGKVGPGCHYGPGMLLEFELCRECNGKGYHIIPDRMNTGR